MDTNSQGIQGGQKTQNPRPKQQPPAMPQKERGNETPRREIPKTNTPDYGDRPEQMPQIEDDEENAHA